MTTAHPEPSRPRRRAAQSAALVAEVVARGGVAPVPALVRGDFSRHDLDAALRAGVIVRVRRGWVAIPGADPLLEAAARRGVVLSCVTAARRIGLAVLEPEDAPHVAAAPNRSSVTHRGAVVHWNAPLVTRHPHALVDGIENVLALTAACLPHEQALVVWESALQTRQVTRETLARLPFRGKAKRVHGEVTPFSGSLLETIFLTRLRWLRIRIVPQAWIAGHRVDFLLGERLIVQIDGGTHVGPQRSRDIAHDAELMLQGFHIIRLSYAQVIDDWPGVQLLIMQAIAHGLHLAV